MIRNWDKLPQRTRAAYLQEANKSGQRLIAGQEKTMKTMRTKYLAHAVNPHNPTRSTTNLPRLSQGCAPLGEVETSRDVGEKFESSMFGLHQHPKVREMLGLGLLGDWLLGRVNLSAMLSPKPDSQLYEAV